MQNRTMKAGICLFLLLFQPLVSTGMPAGNPPGQNSGSEYQSPREEKEPILLNRFVIQESMNIYDFPEELISYTLNFPTQTVKKEQLKLTRADGVESIPYQLSGVVESGDYLERASIHFRTGLQKKETLEFRLTCDPAYQASFEDRVRFRDLGNGTAVIMANQQAVKVPFNVSKPGSSHTPLMAVSRDQGSTWTGKGSWEGKMPVSLETTILEAGNLFLKYRLDYGFGGRKHYRAIITVRHDESFVTVDEYLSGFGDPEASFFRFSYKNGVDPDGRIAYNMFGYRDMSGTYDKNLDRHGKLPLQVGLWNVHSNQVPYGVTFWNDEGTPDNAILFTQYRHHEWKTAEHYSYHGDNKPEVLYFYRDGQDKYMQVALYGKERHWAIAVIPRDEVTMTGIGRNECNQWPLPESRTYRVDLNTLGDYLDDPFGIGPEERLHRKLTYLSLDKYKDYETNWDESLAKYGEEGKTGLSHDDLWIKSGGFRKSCYQILHSGLEGHPSAQLGGPFEAYANSRAGWSPAERKHMRSLLLWHVNMLKSDMGYPYQSMIGGHPNFIISHKKYLGYACAAFPNHPQAETWKNAFITFMDTYLDDYVRDGSKAHNLYPGRFMENPANYMPVSLYYLYQGSLGIYKYDKTYLFNREEINDWIHYTMDILVPHMRDNDGSKCVMTLPIGDHADVNRWLVNGNSWKEPHNFRLQQIARFMRDVGKNPLAEDFLGLLTGGAEGTRPVLSSKIYADMGVVMHYDMAGPDEAMLSLMQKGESTGQGNYRWPKPGVSGQLFYVANNRVWSWNATEDGGWKYVPYALCAYTIDGKSLGDINAKEEHGLLYNFDFAQFYQATGSEASVKRGYLSRSIMMLGNDFMAVYDDVADESVSGIFQWANEENGLVGRYYHNSDFTAPAMTRIDNHRFPVLFDWGEQAPHPSMEADDFSVRWESHVKSFAGVTGDYQFLIDLKEGNRDRVRMWFDGKLRLDVTGEDGSFSVRLEDGKYYPFKMEYQHFSGEAQCLIGLNQPGGLDSDSHGIKKGYNARSFYVRRPLPQIHSVKGALKEPCKGDQLHVVAPANDPVNVSNKPYGARVNDACLLLGEEHATGSDRQFSYSGKAGYATAGELALFHGSKIGYGDFKLALEGGDFGASARYEGPGRISGRFAGKEGGIIRLTVPPAFHTGNADLIVDGKPARYTLDKQTFVFHVSVKQSDGTLSYEINGTSNLP